MSLESPIVPADAAGETEPGLAELFVQLTGDVREMAQAEVELVKARAFVRIDQFKSAAILFAIAGVLALAALIALLVGLTMTVATLVGPGFATAIVVGLTLAVAAVLALLGRSALSPKDGAR